MIKQIDTIERYVDIEINARIDVIMPRLNKQGEVIPEADLEVKYIGTAIIGSPDGQQQFPIQFEIKGVADIEEAYGKFKECAEARLEELEKEYERQQVEQAGAIIGPDGKPLKENQTATKPLIFPSR